MWLNNFNQRKVLEVVPKVVQPASCDTPAAMWFCGDVVFFLPASLCHCCAVFHFSTSISDYLFFGIFKRLIEKDDRPKDLSWRGRNCLYLALRHVSSVKSMSVVES